MSSNDDESNDESNYESSDSEENQMWTLSLRNGDKLDVYDEERGWWESATIKTMNKHLQSFSLQFDQNTDEILWPSLNTKSLKMSIGATFECQPEDFDFASYGMYTIKNIKPLLFPRNVFVNNNITNIIDKDGNEFIIASIKNMINTMNTTNTTNKNKKYIVFNCNTEQYKTCLDINDLYKNCDKFDKPKLRYFSLKHQEKIKKMVESMFSKHKNNNIIVESVLLSSKKCIYIHIKNISKKKSYDLFINSDNNNKDKVKYNLVLSKVDRICGKLIYIESYNRLMYFGGFDYNKNEFSNDIWYYDIDDSNEFKLYSLCLPIKDDQDYNVINYGDFIIIIYTNKSRKIFIYNLLNNKVWTSSKEFPCPYKGKAITIKTCDDFVYFMNATKNMKQYKCKMRPYHFKMCLNELIPKQWQINHKQRYKKLQCRYIHNHLNELNYFNRGLSLFISKDVERYFPLFL